MFFLVYFILFLIPVYIICLVGYSLLKGAPYAPLGNERIKVMIKLLDLKKKQTIADIGSGDGRIVIAFAKNGIEAHGFEINPVLVLLSRYYIQKQHLQNKAFIHWKNIWYADLSRFDGLTLYGITHMMLPLEKKLQQEAKPGAKIVSNHFQFPSWKPVRVQSDVRLYIKK